MCCVQVALKIMWLLDIDVRLGTVFQAIASDVNFAANPIIGVSTGTVSDFDSGGLSGVIHLFWFFCNHLPLLSFAMAASWKP